MKSLSCPQTSTFVKTIPELPSDIRLNPQGANHVCGRRQYLTVFHFFPEKLRLDIHMNSLLGRGFT